MLMMFKSNQVSMYRKCILRHSCALEKVGVPKISPSKNKCSFKILNQNLHCEINYVGNFRSHGILWDL